MDTKEFVNRILDSTDLCKDLSDEVRERIFEKARDELKKEYSVMGEIVDELCTCGHTKSAHTGLQGRGICTEIKCYCVQFTWKHWIVK